MGTPNLFRRIALISLASIAIATVVLAASATLKEEKDLSALWAQLIKEEKAKKPQSVQRTADEIIKLSRQEQRSIDEAIAWRKKLEAAKSVDFDECNDLLKNLQTRIKESDDDRLNTFLHLLASDAYLEHWASKGDLSRRRPEIPDTAALTLDSWTRTQFERLLQEHLNAVKPLLGDSAQFSGTNHQFLFPHRDKILNTLTTAQQNEDYLLSMLYKRAFTSGVFDIPETLEVEKFFVSGSDYIGLDPSSGDKNIDNYLRIWQQLLRSAEQQERLFVRLDLIRLKQLGELCNGQVITNIKQKGRYEALLLQMIEQYKDREAAIDLLLEVRSQYNLQEANLPKLVDYMKTAIRLYDKSEGVEELKKNLQSIEFPSITLGGLSNWLEGVEDSVIIKGINVREVILTVYQAPFPTQLKFLNRSEDVMIFERKKDPGKVYFTKKIKFDPSKPYSEKSLSLPLTFNAPGEYLLKLEDAEKRRIPETNKPMESYFAIEVSRYLYYIQTDGVNNEASVIRALDGGVPRKQIEIELYDVNEPQLRYLRNITPNQWGEFMADKKLKTWAFRIIEDGKPVTRLLRPWGYLPEKKENNALTTQTTLHTDRIIYRPGQKVGYKGVISQVGSKKFVLTVDKDFLLEAFDPSGKKILSQKGKTSDMGSFAGWFMLPESLMGGNCSFKINGEYAGQFKVEEYKRPTFELAIDPIKQTYTFGDTIEISGYIKNYAGMSTDNIEVKLSLSRPTTFYRRGPKYPELPASSTIVKTDRNGRFVWKYHLPAFFAQVYPDQSYSTTSTILAVCTDDKGESKETKSSLPLSFTPYSFIHNMPDRIDLGEPNDYIPTVCNRNGEPQPVKVDMQWQHLSSKQQFETQTASNVSVDFSFAQNYPKGHYLVKLWVTDALGRKSEQEHKVYLFDSRNAKLPETLSFYLKHKADKHEFASFIIATTLPEQNVTIDVFNESERVERIRLKLSNEIKRVTLSHKPMYGKESTIYITYVDNGIVRNERIEVSAPTEQQTIAMQWVSLRDHMTPNAPEEWKLRWIDSSKLFSKAELCITMYDASLNQFAELSLPDRLKFENHNVQFPYYQNSYTHRYNPTFRGTYRPYNNRYNITDDDVFGSSGLEYLVVTAFGSGQKKASMVGSTKRTNNNAPSAIFKEDDMMKGNAMDREESAATDASDLRTEFVETALFEPQLHPDNDGYCTIKFRAPQSLTRWSVKAWGYNQKGDIARLDTTVVTRKELTVQPNVPRFFREGDSPVLMANVANLTQEHQQVSVRMILYTTEGDTLVDRTQALELAAQSTVPVSTTWEVPGKSEQIIYEVWASSAKHSDAERHLIPILRRDVTVNSGIPFFLKGETTEVVSIPDELKKALQNGRLDEVQLEIVQNPIFFAVKSLPLILDLTSDNALAVSQTLFARMMAQHLMTQNPEVIGLIQAWEKGSDGKTSLERSAQFKLTSIDQTPFFAAVNREQEAMQQWSWWINNPEQLGTSNRAAFELLKTMQQSDGGFAWFKGQKSSFFISMRIAKLLTTLSLHGANTAKGEHEMRVNLINYLDKEMIRMIERTPARKRNNHYWAEMLVGNADYLALRADYRDIPFPSRLLANHKKMMKQIGKGWKGASFHTQAQLTKAALAYGFKKEATAIVESLLEHTKADRLGRHFPNNRAWTLSNTAQLATQIAFIEALAVENKHPKEMKELTQWIFAQYQTQRMFNPVVATQGLDLILRTLETVNPEGTLTVTIGGRTLQPSQADRKSPVLTYKLTTYDLKNALDGLQIDQSGKSIAWGGLLYRYQSPIDEVQDKSGDLSIHKQYFRPADGGKLTPANDAHPLKVGEKLVMRYTIQASRDFDYVQIQDLKGAFAEAVQPLSQYRVEGGLWFYSEPKDKVTNLFFYFVPKGTYTIDYPVWVNASGEYSIGTASIQSAMSPEFVSFSGAQRMTVTNK